MRCRLVACALACITGLVPVVSHAADDYPQIRVSAGRLEYGDHALDSVRLSLQPNGVFRFEAGSPRLAAEAAPSGTLELTGRLDSFSLSSESLQGSGLLQYAGLETDWRLQSRGEEVSLCLRAAARALQRLGDRDAVPRQVAWLTGGELGACLRYRQVDAMTARASIDLAIDELAFDSPDGRFAAAGLEARLSTEVDPASPETAGIEGELGGGELLLDNFYADFSRSPVAFELQPRWNDGRIGGFSLAARDEDAFRVDAAARLPADDDNNRWTVEIRKLELRFPGAYRDYLEPLAAAWSLDGLEVTGAASWQGSFSAAGVESGDLAFSDLSVVDTRRERFALTGLQASLRPGDYAVDSLLSWRGLLLGRINLGAGAAVLDPEPGAFALLKPLNLSVLGGALRLEHIKYVLPGSLSEQSGGSRFEMKARIDDVDMEQLTAALGWPTFSGRLSGELPGARLADGVLSVDGGIDIDVFGGHVTISELEAERLFGVLPSLQADIAMQGLDLERLTETFEFGHISGRVDGFVNGLRMLDWQPVAFDAWLGTPAGQDRRNSISRKAVNHLTQIGGGGTAAALSGPLLRMFSSFSYRRLGLGCRLQNHVCEVRGIGEDGDSVLLMEGAGIPKITVRAWNRNVDWPQMVANLAAVTGGEGVSIGEPPQ
jgi:hypothetical protein